MLDGLVNDLSSSVKLPGKNISKRESIYATAIEMDQQPFLIRALVFVDILRFERSRVANNKLVTIGSGVEE